jgi:hypothetical protein
MLGIDTVILTLYPHEFAILRPGDFTPNTNRITALEPRDMGRGRYMNAKRNPTKQDNATVGYLPYVTFYKAVRAGGMTTELRIQFSASKLVYGNSLDELLETDIDLIYQRLFDGLKYYGIRFFKGMDTLVNARVAAIHYAKNFPLDNFMTAHEAITEIQKCDVSSWRDVSQSDYINNGHGFKTHSKYYELAFYDKLAEYNKGRRNQPVFDKDLQLQMDLFGGKQTVQPLEVIRMEARLNNAKTIKTALKKAGFDGKEVTFDALCKKDVSQAVLKQQLAELYSRYPKISDAQAPDLHALFSELYVQNPNRSIATLLSAVGMRALTQEFGTRKLKDIVGIRGSPALLRQAKVINKELAYRHKQPEVFQILNEQLDRFEPVRVTNLIKDENNKL